MHALVKAVRPITLTPSINLASGNKFVYKCNFGLPKRESTNFSFVHQRNDRFHSIGKPYSTKKPNEKKSDTPQSASELDTLIQIVEKAHGKGSVMRLAEANSKLPTVPVISTGSLGLDLATGLGGLPRGRVVEIYGMESSGKTTLALNVIAEAHKLGGKCCFIDAEHAIDPNWAKKLGVKTEELLICQPDSGEQALEIVDTLIESGTMDVIVVDSVSALVTKAELEGDMGSHHPGSQARLMSQALRKITGNLGKHNKTVLIFINQIRHKIGVMFGSPETTSGGNALRFYSSIRLDVRKAGSLKSGDHVTGSHIRVKIVKNKLAAPFKETSFDIEFGKGISRFGELVDIAATGKLLDKSGAWYSFKGEKIAQGREKAKVYFEQNPAQAQELEKAVREKFLAEGGLTMGSQGGEAETEEGAAPTEK